MTKKLCSDHLGIETTIILNNNDDDQNINPSYPNKKYKKIMKPNKNVKTLYIDQTISSE